MCVLSASPHKNLNVVDGAGLCLRRGEGLIYSLAITILIEHFSPGFIAWIDADLFYFEAKAGFVRRYFHSEVDVIYLDATI